MSRKNKRDTKPERDFYRERKNNKRTRAKRIKSNKQFSKRKV